jgi:hypothetical protein
MVQYFKSLGLALLLSVGVGSVGQSSSNSVAVVNNVTELEFSYLNAIPTGPLGSNFDKGWCCHTSRRYLSATVTASVAASPVATAPPPPNLT